MQADYPFILKMIKELKQSPFQCLVTLWQKHCINGQMKWSGCGDLVKVMEYNRRVLVSS